MSACQKLLSLLSLLIAGCSAGAWDVEALSRLHPLLEDVGRHHLGDTTPFLLPLKRRVVFFLCRWPNGRPIPLSISPDVTPEERAIVDLAAAAWEAALGIEFERRTSNSGEGIEVRFADPEVRRRQVAGHAHADCEVDLASDAGDVLRSRLVSASIELRRVQSDLLGREIPLEREEIVGSALHEMGHALGFSGHARGGKTVMVRSVDDVRRAGRRLLAGAPFRDSTLRALYRVPSGSVVRRATLSAASTRNIDALADLAVALGLRGPFVRVGDDLARIEWRGPDGRSFPFSILDPAEGARSPELLRVLTARRTRELLERNGF